MPTSPCSGEAWREQVCDRCERRFAATFAPSSADVCPACGHICRIATDGRCRMDAFGLTEQEVRDARESMDSLARAAAASRRLRVLDGPHLSGPITQVARALDPELRFLLRRSLREVHRAKEAAS